MRNEKPPLPEYDAEETSQRMSTIESPRDDWKKGLWPKYCSHNSAQQEIKADCLKPNAHEGRWKCDRNDPQVAVNDDINNTHHALGHL